MKGLARDQKRTDYRANPIQCSKCGGSDGTLVKIDTDHYKHQDSRICRLRRLKKGL